MNLSINKLTEYNITSEPENREQIVENQCGKLARY